jgi:uncharacterized protein (TIGR02246 family)
MRFSTSVVLVLGITVAACQPPLAEAPTDVSGEIRLANEGFTTAFAAQDAGALASLYTSDGQLLPPNSDFVEGQDAIRAFWQGAMDAGVAEATLTTAEAFGTDSMAIEVGRYELSAVDGTTVDAGKYIVWWKRTAAGWRLHRDIWNSSRPAS